MAIKCYMASLELERNGKHCEACEVPGSPSPLPGILWPFGHEDGEHWYVDRCDMCQRYPTDDMAAGALWHYILHNELENHYLLGLAEWGPQGLGGGFIDWVYKDVPGFEEDTHPLEQLVRTHPDWEED